MAAGRQSFYTPSALCPITFDVMKDPLVDSRGHSFEKDAILKWMQRGRRHPLDGVDMEGDLYPNNALKNVIQETSQLIKELYQKIDKLEREKKSAPDSELREINSFLQHSNNAFHRENSVLQEANVAFQLEISLLQEHIMGLKDIAKEISEELRLANIDTLKVIQEKLAAELRVAHLEEELVLERSKVAHLTSLTLERTQERKLESFSRQDRQEAKEVQVAEEAQEFRGSRQVQSNHFFRQRAERVQEAQRAPNPSLPRLDQAFRR